MPATSTLNRIVPAGTTVAPVSQARGKSPSAFLRYGTTAVIAALLSALVVSFIMTSERETETKKVNATASAEVAAAEQRATDANARADAAITANSAVVKNREAAVTERENSATGREVAVLKREQAVDAQEKALDLRALAVAKAEKKIKAAQKN